MSPHVVHDDIQLAALRCCPIHQFRCLFGLREIAQMVMIVSEHLKLGVSGGMVPADNDLARP